MDKLSNIPQKIFNFFTQMSETLATESEFKRRQSKLTPRAFITALIRSCFSQQFSLELLRSHLKEQNIVISKQALFERFNQRTVEFVKSLALAGLEHFKTERLSQLDLFKSFTAVHIIDSSTISLNKTLSELFKGCGGAGSSAAVKIQVMFDQLNGQVKDIALTAGRENDQGFDKFLDCIQKDSLYLMDLGYFKLKSFKKIIDGGAFFISRLLTGTQLLTMDGKPFELIKILPMSSALFTSKLLMGKQAKIPIRLVAQRLSLPIAEKRRQKLKSDYRRRGISPSKELLNLQDWSIYITNTCEKQLSIENIHHGYACRWQIELFFKLSKSLMQIDTINTTKSYRVYIEIYSKFICMMILFLLCSPMRELQNQKEISFYKACKLLINKATDFVRALNSIYRLKQFVNTFCEDLKLFAVKEIKKTSNKQKIFTENGF